MRHNKTLDKQLNAHIQPQTQDTFISPKRMQQTTHKPPLVQRVTCGLSGPGFLSRRWQTRRQSSPEWMRGGTRNIWSIHATDHTRSLKWTWAHLSGYKHDHLQIIFSLILFWSSGIVSNILVGTADANQRLIFEKIERWQTQLIWRICLASLAWFGGFVFWVCAVIGSFLVSCMASSFDAFCFRISLKWCVLFVVVVVIGRRRRRSLYSMILLVFWCSCMACAWVDAFCLRISLKCDQNLIISSRTDWQIRNSFFFWYFHYKVTDFWIERRLQTYSNIYKLYHTCTLIHNIYTYSLIIFCKPL